MPPVFCPAVRGIMIRGIERRKMFHNNKDREDFIERLEILCPEMQIAERLSEVLGMRPDEVFSKGRQDRKVRGRSLSWPRN